MVRRAVPWERALVVLADYAATVYFRDRWARWWRVYDAEPGGKPQCPPLTSAAHNVVLLAAAPLLALRDSFLADAKQFGEWNLDSEAARVLARVATRLDGAIRAARDVKLWVSVEDIVHMTNKPRATITRICRTARERVGASKVNGSWIIYWPAFEAYLRTGDIENTNEEAA